MKKLIITAIISGFFLLSCSRENTPPNFLFILVDDLGWTDLSCYGSDFYETPNLDRLAENGLMFSDAYASCPVCSPTRASIMTGKYPSRLNITDWIPGNDPKDRKLLGPSDKHMLPLEEYTLTEALKDNGYTTFFAGKWHLGDEGFFPENQGFDINIGGHHRGSPPGGYYTPYQNPKLDDGPQGEYLTDRLTDETISFMEQNSDKPFLAYLAFYTIHTPIQANMEYIDHFELKKQDLGEEGLPARRKEHEGSTVINQVGAPYASMVAAMDKNIGKLLSFLQASGMNENTYIFFTSDNGGLSTLYPEWGPAPTSVLPLRAGKGWCYEGGIRVPLIIAGPGINANKTTSLAISTDFYPTILELAGLSPLPEQHVDGISLASLLFNNTVPDRQEIFWHYPHYHGSTWTPGAAIRQGDWKLIEFYDYDKTELYMLAEDIGEMNDLSDKYPDKTKELKLLLKEMQEESGALFPKTNPQFKAK